ncbi:MAG: helicase HerA-like domain-containing protein [Alphaproteobacteria bacterium]
MTDTILLGATSDTKQPVTAKLKYLNRHGLIAGATGTGKTVTLQVLAEQLSANGIAVFAADVKGDLSGLAEKGLMQDFLVKRATDIGLTDYTASANPVAFWDVFGQQGHPLRTTVAEMGPLLLSRILELNDTQAGVVAIAFQLAMDDNMPLLDLADLRAVLIHLGENMKDIQTRYGMVSTASIGAIQRSLLTLEQQGGTAFFGEPALNVADLLRVENGRGIVNILAADKLMQSPQLYATFLLWLLNELFTTLPEVGDLDKPKIVFFFDEAHLLFTDAPKALLQQVEQVVKLIRSKGVGIFFITQSPTDVPETVLAQLGFKVQHALRAFTPKGVQDVKKTAESFRPNPAFDTAQVVANMIVGEALVSTLEKDGIPSIVQRTLIRPPVGKLGPIDPAVRQTLIQNSLLGRLYNASVNRESAYEMLAKRRAEKQDIQAQVVAKKGKQGTADEGADLWNIGSNGGKRQGYAEVFAKTVVRAAGSTVARQIGRALLDSFLKK